MPKLALPSPKPILTGTIHRLCVPLSQSFRSGGEVGASKQKREVGRGQPLASSLGARNSRRAVRWRGGARCAFNCRGGQQEGVRVRLKGWGRVAAVWCCALRCCVARQLVGVDQLELLRLAQTATKAVQPQARLWPP